MLKIIALHGLSTATPAALRAADSRACAAMPLRLGVPRTGREWTALVKVASGETDITPAQHARLASLGLIALNAGAPELTSHGRVTLGLPE